MRALGREGGGQAAPCAHVPIPTLLSACPAAGSGQGRTCDPGAALGAPARDPSLGAFNSNCAGGNSLAPVSGLCKPDALQVGDSGQARPHPCPLPSEALRHFLPQAARLPEVPAFSEVSVFAASFCPRHQGCDGRTPPGLAGVMSEKRSGEGPQRTGPRPHCSDPLGLK